MGGVKQFASHGGGRGGSTTWKLKVLLAVGFVLGAVAFIETVAGYRQVSGRLLEDHLARRGELVASELERRALQERPRDTAELEATLRRIVAGASSEIAWIRVAGANGSVLAGAGEEIAEAAPRPVALEILPGRAHSLARAVRMVNGERLVVSMPLRHELGSGEEAGTLSRPEGLRDLEPSLVEVALRMGWPQYRPLRRHLVVGLAAAGALLALIIVTGPRIDAYLNGLETRRQAETARQVQDALLPRAEADPGGLELAHHFEPLHEVAGDYYDFFPVGEDRYALVLGDVSGKGIPASLLMAQLHGAVRSLAVGWDGSNEAALMRRLNALLFETTPSNRFATLFLAFFDRATSTLHYVNAGHPPAFAAVEEAEPGGWSIVALPAGGPPLGLLQEASYRSGALDWSPGMVLVVYSDGLLESVSKDGQEFGEERLVAAIEQLGNRPVRDMCKALVQRLRAFTGPMDLADDLTLLVARVESSPRLESGCP